jgi:hypothetical protein
MHRAPRTLIATLLVGLLSLSGCILGANTGGESPDTNTVSDTAVSDTGVADSGEPEDVDGGEERCDYKGKPDGVCLNGVFSPSGCLLPGQYDYVNEEDGRHCDEVDNDCDGVVDELCACTPDFVTEQMEENGVCSNASRNEDGECELGGFVEVEDDTDCDALDNDCDGEVDEECSCMPGESGENENPPEEEECFPADSSYLGVGACEVGRRTCHEDGTWGACEGAVVPQKEDCDTPEDENCDGTVNESCPCDYDGKTEGVCRGGGKLTGPGMCTVEPPLYESTEVSNDGKDNDCDGKVDEGTVDAGGQCKRNEVCRSGRCFKDRCAQRIFVTSSRWDGSQVGGLRGADNKCQTLAWKVGLGGNWAAIITDSSTKLRSRLTFLDGAYVNMNSSALAGKTDGLFDGAIDTPVEYNERAKPVRLSAAVWTGLDRAGAPVKETCNGWTATGSRLVGSAGSALIATKDTNGNTWISGVRGRSCSGHARLYCLDGQ